MLRLIAVAVAGLALTASAQALTPAPLLQPARRERPRRRRAAECDQQLPPSDDDCHTPLPCEVRRGNDTTSRACSLAVQGGQDASLDAVMGLL